MRLRSKRWSTSHSLTAGALAAILTVLSPGLLTADQPSPSDLVDVDDPDSATLGEALGLIDDQEIGDAFAKALVKLKDDGKTGEVEDLKSQLETERSCEVDLPTPTVSFPLLPEHVYGASRGGVLCLGSIYNCGKCEKWHARLAGGIILTDDGVAVTNYHIMAREGAAAFGAMTDDGLVLPITKVLAASEEDDLAIVQMDVTAAYKPQKLVGTKKPADANTGGGALTEDTEPLTPAILAHHDAVGEPVWVISHPAGRFYTLSTGVISRYYTKPVKSGTKKPIRFSITADFARGSSGCGVFNSSGKLTGLVKSTNSIYYSREEGEDQNLQMVIKECIPARCIKALIVEPDEE